jgi:glutamate-1-semialdehyde 2,1-aminomutase
MEMVAPAGTMYQAGTMSGNPAAVAAGLATLAELAKPGVYAKLEDTAQALCVGLAEAAGEAGVSVQINQLGAMFTVFFTDQPVSDWETAKVCDTAKFGRYHRLMREAGVYLPPSQFEANFVSLAHGPAEVEATLAAARKAFRAL